MGSPVSDSWADTHFKLIRICTLSLCVEWCDFFCLCVALLAYVVSMCVPKNCLHYQCVNWDSPKKYNLDIRVKCTTCLLSLGLATGAASSACRFLQKDWAPVKTGLLWMTCLTMADTQTHTPTHPHAPHKQRHKLKNILESSALLNYDDDDDAFAVLCLLFIYVEMIGFVNQIHKFQLVTNNFIYTI